MNDLHRAFLEEYKIDFNGSRAARAVGKTPATAHEWLRREDIREELDRYLTERRAKNKLTVETIENMIRDLAEVEVIDLFDEDGELRPLRDMPPHARRAIKSIKKVTKEHYVTGQQEVTMQVELWDKKGAIELLGKHRKMFTDKLEVEGMIKTRVTFIVDGVAK